MYSILIELHSQYFHFKKMEYALPELFLIPELKGIESYSRLKNDRWLNGVIFSLKFHERGLCHF